MDGIPFEVKNVPIHNFAKCITSHFLVQKCEVLSRPLAIPYYSETKAAKEYTTVADGLYRAKSKCNEKVSKSKAKHEN